MYTINLKNIENYLFKSLRLFLLYELILQIVHYDHVNTSIAQN